MTIRQPVLYRRLSTPFQFRVISVDKKTPSVSYVDVHTTEDLFVKRGTIQTFRSQEPLDIRDTRFAPSYEFPRVSGGSSRRRGDHEDRYDRYH